MIEGLDDGIVLGIELGDDVLSELGETVGTCVGVKEEGALVIWLDGFLVGKTEGTGVGDEVALLEGMDEGIKVEELDGGTVNLDDGIAVGSALGALDTTDVGKEEGDRVGCTV